MINLKEIHEEKRKKLIQKVYKNIIFYETCEYYWYQKQQGILDYIEINKFELKNKNILVLSDDIGLCCIMLSKIGSNVWIKKINEISNKNMDMNYVNPKIYTKNETIDYIFEIEDRFVEPIDLKDDRKMIIALNNIYCIPLSNYSIKQISPYRSKINTLFEIQKHKSFWLLK